MAFYKCRKMKAVAAALTIYIWRYLKWGLYHFVIRPTHFGQRRKWFQLKFRLLKKGHFWNWWPSVVPEEVPNHEKIIPDPWIRGKESVDMLIKREKCVMYDDSFLVKKVAVEHETISWHMCYSVDQISKSEKLRSKRATKFFILRLFKYIV